MKIGFISPYLDTLGGGERYVLTLASHWSKRHDVAVFWNDENIMRRARDRFHLDVSNIEVVRNIFREENAFRKLFITRLYDLLFFLSDGSIPTSAAPLNILHFQCPFPNALGRSYLNRLKLSRFSRVVCNSFFTKRYIDVEYGVCAQVVYPPVDIAQWEPRTKKKAILSVGRFSRWFINKKQEEMVSFFRAIASRRADWQLWLAGGLMDADRAYFDAVKRKAQGLPVKLFPNATFRELQRLYGEASVYWHAAGFGESEETNPAGMEHFGISTVEAMAAGAVPVVFSGGGQPEIVSDGENGFLWKNGEELLEKTFRVMEDGTLRRAMGEKARERSRIFSGRRFCEAFDALLYEITKAA